MKNHIIIKFICFTFILFVFTGCIEKVESREPLTRTGKNIFNSWSFAIGDVNYAYIAILFKFNEWYDAPAAEKHDLEDLYFSCFKIRELEDGKWGIFKGSTLCYSINRNGKSLVEADAIWEVICEHATNRYFYYDEFDYSFSSSSFEKLEYTIHSQGNLIWTINMANDFNPQSYLNLTIESLNSKVPFISDQSDFTISGNGQLLFCNTDYNSYYSDIIFDQREFALLSFEIEEKMRGITHSLDESTFFNAFWKNGKINLKASENQDTEVFTSASFINPGPDVFITKIAYKGVSENWENERVVEL